MTKTEFLTKLAKRLRSYDFCATLLDDEWSERMSERAMAYLTDEEELALSEIEEASPGGSDDQDARCEAIQLVLSAFLWYQIKNQLASSSLKRSIKLVRDAAKADWSGHAGLGPVADYLETLADGAFLLEVKSEGA